MRLVEKERYLSSHLEIQVPLGHLRYAFLCPASLQFGSVARPHSSLALPGSSVTRSTSTTGLIPGPREQGLEEEEEEERV
jgi:hypothetical protein